MAQESGISEDRADYKVSGGKLIRVRVWHRDGVIEKIRFHGDFFMHPEEAIEDLEEKLIGTHVDDAPSVINEFFEGVELAGASPEDFATAIRIAIYRE